MKKYIVIVLVLILTSGIVIAQHYRTRPPVTVQDYYISDGYLRVYFNINREDVSGTFTWSATYEHRRIPQTMEAHGRWRQGDTSVDCDMYVGGEIVMRNVRVVRVDVNGE